MAGEVRLAGHPIAWHQLQAAIALACERIVCLADAPGPALAALQRDAEKRGTSFHTVTHHRALSGLVSAADTLLVFAPGVMPDREWLAQAFGARAGVAVLPAEGAIELGYERIDRDRAWAGVLATRGDAVESLAVLAPDADPIGGLLRIALQRGASSIPVPDKWVEDGQWALVVSPAAANRYQADWYARRVPPPSPDRPGEAAAYRLARRLLDRGGDGSGLPAWLAGGGALVAAGSAIAGYLGWTFAGLTGLAVASMILATAATLCMFAKAGSGETQPKWHVEAHRALLDLSLVAIAFSPVAFAGWGTAFAAAVMVAVMRLTEEDGIPRALRPFADRPLVFSLLAAAAAAGIVAPAMAALALAGLALRLFMPTQRG